MGGLGCSGEGGQEVCVGSCSALASGRKKSAGSRPQRITFLVFPGRLLLLSPWEKPPKLKFKSLGGQRAGRFPGVRETRCPGQKCYLERGPRTPQRSRAAPTLVGGQRLGDPGARGQEAPEVGGGAAPSVLARRPGCGPPPSAGPAHQSLLFLGDALTPWGSP